MTAVRSILLRFSTNATSISREIGLLSKSHREMNDALKQFGHSSDEAKKAIGSYKDQVAQAQGVAGRFSLLMGGAMVVALGASVMAAAHFEEQMSKMGVAASLTTRQLGAVSSTILEMSTRIPVSIEALATSFTAFRRAGFDVQESLVLMQTASRIAVASGEDAGAIATSLADVANATGASVKETIQIINLAEVAWKHGQGSLQDFTKGMQQLAPIARAAHVPINEVAAAMTVLTKAGLPAGQAAQGLNRILAQIGRAGSDINAAVRDLRDASGKAYGTADKALEAEGIGAFFRALKENTKLATDGISTTIESLEKLYPSIRALRPVTVFAGIDMKELANQTKFFADATAVAIEVQKDYEQRQGTFANQLKLTKNELHAATVSLGQAFLPAARGALEAVSGMADMFANLDKGGRNLVATVAAMTAGFLLLGGAALMFGLALGPLLAVVAPLVAIGALFAHHAMEAAKARRAVMEYKDAWREFLATGDISQVGVVFAQHLGSEKLKSLTDDLGVSTTRLNSMFAENGGIEERAKFLQEYADKLNLTKKNTKELMEGVKGGGDAFVPGKKKSMWDTLWDDLGSIAPALAGPAAGLTNATPELPRETLDKLTNKKSDIYKTLISHGATAEQVADLAMLSKEFMRLDDAEKLASAEAKILDDANKAALPGLIEMGAAAGQDQIEMFKWGSSIDKTNGHLQELTKALAAFGDANSVFADATNLHKIYNKEFENTGSVFTNLLQEQAKAVHDDADEAAKANVTKIDHQIDKLREMEAQWTSSGGKMFLHSAEHGGDTLDSLKTIQQKIKDLEIEKRDDPKHQLKPEDFLPPSTSDKWNVAMDKFLAGLDDAAKTSLTSRTSINKARDEIVKFFQDSDPDHDALLAEKNADRIIGELDKMGGKGSYILDQLTDGSVKAQKNLRQVIKDINDIAPSQEASEEDYAKALQRHFIAQARFKEDLLALQGGAGGGMNSALVQQFVAMGPKGAELAHAAAKSMGNEAGKASIAEANAVATALMTASTEPAVRAFAGVMDAVGEAAQYLKNSPDNPGTIAGKLTVEGFAEAAKLTPALAQTIIDSYSTWLPGLIAAGQVSDPNAPTVVPKGGGAWGNHPVTSLAPPPVTLRPSLSSPEHQRAIYGAADGAILRFANGGFEEHLAHIASTTRMFAEPETGGEAYIPLAHSKRGRSMDILGNVANRFGFNLEPVGSLPASSGSPWRHGGNDGHMSAVMEKVVALIGEAQRRSGVQHMENKFYASNMSPQDVSREIAWTLK